MVTKRGGPRAAAERGEARDALFISCNLGLEPLLERELRALGHAGKAETGGVAVETPRGAYRELNLWLRTAGRVLLRVGEVPLVKDPSGALAKVDLSAFVDPARGFEVHAAGARPRELEAAGLKAWKRLGAKPSPPHVPGVKVAAEQLRVQLRADGGRVQVSVDTSGELLYFRGYREEVGHAPMRETLAAGVLMLAGWDARTPLWDVMCGSGTLVIEAALLALGRAPGAQRRFAFEKFPSHDPAAFAALPRRKELPGAIPPLTGSDLNAGSVGIARRNATRAGVVEHLRLERLDATRLVPAAGTPPGLVVANLPYGKRVGDVQDLPGLYRALGENLRRHFGGWRYALLAAGHEDALGLYPDAMPTLENGGLRCRLLLGRIG